jgi:hypothetical protein
MLPLRMMTHRPSCLALITTACAVMACEPGGPTAQQPVPSAPTPSGAAADPTAPQPSATASSEPDESTAKCKSLRKRFADRLAGATNACKTSADCTCSPGGIDPAGCGQVVDSETAKALYLLYNEFRTDCGLDRNCAPRRCLTQCTNGYCREDYEARDRATPKPPPDLEPR